MKLERRKVKINDVVFGDKNEVVGEKLVLNREELVNYIKSLDNIKEVTVDIAKPGEKTRIIPVKDVIEPRVKVEGVPGFAGITSQTGQLGNGAYNVLEGVAIVTIGDIVGFQEGVIDMWGEGAKWTPFSKTFNLVVDLSVVDGLTAHEHELAVRMAGLLISEYVGQFAKDAPVYEIETFEVGSNPEETAKYPDLPKVVYAEMLITQGLLHDSYIYGVDAKNIIPTLLHPLEELDGAVVSGNCVAACDKITTYQHQTNPVILELLKKHGKEINFLGVVMVPELTTLEGKFRSCDFTAKLCKQLGADGVIVSEEGYGNPDSDLVMIAERLEKQGIKAVLITDECSGWDGASQPLADSKPEAKAVISTGNVSHVVTLPKADRILGDPEAIANLAGGWAGAYDAETGVMKCELNAVIGATSEIGYHNLMVTEY
ncbi:glycine/sarcosine/betaine reductase component B subunit [Facklamia sp. P12945]|uniref:glycine/sarcosine/betaine reductase component B subunit n=1 Tax=unclassified Facklamia TaxID=2622293 RepID=UPI003D18024A